MKWTVSQTARVVEADAALVKRWAVLFKGFLSVGATPPKGTPRMFSDSDLRIFAEVSKHWEPNPDLESIRAGLGWLDDTTNGKKRLVLLGKQGLERVKGIEPSSQAWEARILPLNHTRFRGSYS